MTDFQFGASSTGSGTGGSQPDDAPEACTLIMIGTGLVALRAFRKHLPTLA